MFSCHTLVNVIRIGYKSLKTCSYVFKCGLVAYLSRSFTFFIHNINYTKEVHKFAITFPSFRVSIYLKTTLRSR